MPYIKPNQRDQLDRAIEDLMIAIIKLTDDDKLIVAGPGVYNYVITTLLNKAYDMRMYPSYDKANTVMGILESAKQEYYRRVVASYEDQKIDENGDVYF